MRDRWLVAILLLAAALRLYGLAHGLPFVYNPDEANIMARALSLAKDPNPHYFLYPNLFFFVLFGMMGGLFVIGRLLGRYESLAAFESRFFEDPTDFYLAGRAIGVLAALGTVLLTYRLADRHFGRTTARAAALFVAVAYFHVRDSHYLKHDVPTGLLLVLAFTAFDRIRQDSDARRYVVAGAAMGVAFATHYYTIFLAPAFALYHWTVSGFRNIGKFFLTAATSAVTFFALSPFVVLDLPVAFDHMLENRRVVVDRSVATGDVFLPSLPSYIRFLAEQGLGYLLLVLVVAGIVSMARRNRRALVLWGAFPVLFFTFVAYTFFAGRYLNPILPSLAVAAGVAVDTVRGRWGGAVAATVAIGACVQPLYFDYQINRLFAGEDTRTLARQWVRGHVASGTTIALQSYSVPLLQSVENLRESLRANGALSELESRGKFSHLIRIAEETSPTYRLLFVGRGDEKNRIYFEYDDLLARRLEPLAHEGTELIVLRYPAASPPPAVAAFFEGVTHRGERRIRISPRRSEESEAPPYMDNEDWRPSPALAHRGPVIEIWSFDAR